MITGSVRLVDSQVRTVQRQSDYSGVVVWLEPAAPGRPAAPADPGPAATMIQRDKQFVPHVLAIPVGAAVEFPNYDPIFHNAFSTFNGQIFDVGLYPPGKSRTVVFARSGIVRVFCNIHPSMSAIIAVLDSRYFAVTGPTGAFSIPNMPPGDYQFRVFHERSTAATLTGLARKITVTDRGMTLPPIVISETGYVATPHKNKYGEDYPTNSDETDFYPGVRR